MLNQEFVIQNQDFVWGLFSRLLGLVLLINFLSVRTQIIRLIGKDGLEPAALLFKAIKRDLGPIKRFLRFPSLFHFSASDQFIRLVCNAGIIASLFIILGLSYHTQLFFLICWVCWLSIQVSNPTLFSFPWDLLLSECTFFAIFLPPLNPIPKIQSIGVPHPAIQFYFSWLLFKVMFGMGFHRFKKRGETDKDLSYIFHFLQWQPMPTTFAYYLRSAPMIFHKFSYGFLFLSEIIMPFFYFGSIGCRELSFIITVVLQLLIWSVGNYGIFNLLTIILALTLLTPLPNILGLFELKILPIFIIFHFIASLPFIFISDYWTGSLWLYQKSALDDGLVKLLKPLHAILRFLAPFRILNSYGVFRKQGIYVKDRLITRIQGSSDGLNWIDYENHFLSGRPDKKPPRFAPFHPRLDHYLFYGLCEEHSTKMFMLMASNPYYFHPFCLTEKLIQKILKNDHIALSFFVNNPFHSTPPQYLRYALYRYRYTPRDEKLKTGNWWNVKLIGTSDAISKRDQEDSFGIRESYDQFIADKLVQGEFNRREFTDPVKGQIPIHLHSINRFADSD